MPSNGGLAAFLTIVAFVAAFVVYWRVRGFTPPPPKPPMPITRADVGRAIKLIELYAPPTNGSAECVAALVAFANWMDTPA